MGAVGSRARAGVTSHAIEVVDAHRFTVGESPVWRARESALYWVDIARRLVVRWAEGEPGLRTWSFDEPVACIAFAGPSRIIAGMQSGVFNIALHEGGRADVLRVATLAHPMSDMRCNDGRCDRAGRFWFGTMHNDMSAAHAVGTLHSFADGALSPPWVDALVTQNGLAFSPDGATMYLSDSHPSRRLVWAFDYDAASGVPSRRRVFADLSQHVGRPDGAAIDTDGCYWSCANDGAALLRFSPDGRLDRRIDLPVAKPSMCAFGGPRLDTLYVTSIRPAGAAADALDGCVLALSAGVQGIEEPEYDQNQRPH